MGEILKFESQITEIENINPLCSRVLIKIAYAGLNRNNLYISRNAFDIAEPSLKICPILGEYSESIEDFRGHGGKLEIKDSTIKWIDTTMPYGFIDTNSEISWQDVEEDNGSVRQYICATGYVWTGRYPELADLIKNSKSHSMEIEIISQQEIEIDGEKVIEITEFIYTGFCILGDDVSPCFEKSSISVYNLDKESFKKQFSKMMSELKFSLSEPYNLVETITLNNPVEMWKCPHCKEFIGEKELYFNNEKWYHSPCVDKGEIQFNKQTLHDLDSSHAKVLQEGGTNLDKVLEMLQKYSLTIEQLQEKNINHEEFSLEELESKVKEAFSLTSEQLEDELRRELAEIETIIEDYYGEIYKSARYYYSDSKPDEGIVVAWDCKNDFLVGFKFTVTGDNVEIDASTGVRYKVDLNPMDLSGDTDMDVELFSTFTSTSKAKTEFMLSAKEKSLTEKFEAEKETIANEATVAFDKLQAEFNTLKEEFTALELKATQADTELSVKLQQEREDAENVIFEAFSKELTEDEMSTIKSKKSEMSLEDIEDKLFSLAGRKNVKFSKTVEKPQFSRMSVDLNIEEDKEDKSKSKSVFARLKNKKYN